jgi:hypothetical protein
MGAQYLGIVWPFFVLILVFGLGLFQSFGKPLLAFLAMGIALSGTLSVSAYINANIEKSSSRLSLQATDRIVVDNVSRGALPRIFLHVPDQTLIFAASQNHLLTHQEKWLCRLNDSSMYISHLSLGAGSIGNSREHRQEILDVIGQEYHVTHVEGGVLGVGEEAFTLTHLAGEESASLPARQSRVQCNTIRDP